MSGLFVSMNLQILHTEILLDFGANYISMSNFVPDLFSKKYIKWLQKKKSQHKLAVPHRETKPRSESLIIQFFICRNQKCFIYSKLTFIGLFQEPNNFFLDICTVPVTWFHKNINTYFSSFCPWHRVLVHRNIVTWDIWFVLRPWEKYKTVSGIKMTSRSSFNVCFVCTTLHVLLFYYVTIIKYFEKLCITGDLKVSTFSAQGDKAVFTA